MVSLVDRNEDVIVVGAGPAGLGCALALNACGVEAVRVIDRDEVGASFRRWPEGMRLITPSFHSNSFGMTDLNAISPFTSPADFLRCEHPEGPAYADYLEAVAAHYELAVETGVLVRDVKPDDDLLTVETSAGSRRARFVIWAVGEFQYPDDGGIEGAEFCRHGSSISDWASVPGKEVAVVGGYESGIDAAIHLTRLGRKVHVFSRGKPWLSDSPDPSRSLSPFTLDRLRNLDRSAMERLFFHPDFSVCRVSQSEGAWALSGADGRRAILSDPPILCTGYRDGLGPVAEHFSDGKGGFRFSEEADEAPHTPGLYYSGPQLRHREALFCFIYKFRARFGIVARDIAGKLGLSWQEPLEPWYRAGFMVEDLSCCTDCQCAFESEVDDPVPTQTGRFS